LRSNCLILKILPTPPTSFACLTSFTRRSETNDCLSGVSRLRGRRHRELPKPDSVRVNVYFAQHTAIIEWTSNPMRLERRDDVEEERAESERYRRIHRCGVESWRSNGADSLGVHCKLGKWDDKRDAVECIRRTLVEVCGDNASVRVAGRWIELEVDGKTAHIDVDNMHVTCSDQLLHHLVSSLCQKMMYALTPGFELLCVANEVLLASLQGSYCLSKLGLLKWQLDESSTYIFNGKMPRRRKHTDDVLSASTTSLDSLTPTLNRFAEDTSMLGFRYLHTRYKTWFRCVWAMLLIFFIGLTIYQVIERIGYYFIRNPLITTRTYYTPSRIAFPTVVVCNKMQLKCVWAMLLIFFIGLTIYQVIERIGYYFIRNPLITTRTYYTPSRIAFPTVVVCNKMQLKSSKIAQLRPDLLRTMSLMYEDDGSPTRNKSVWEMIDSFDRISLSNAYRSAYQTADDFFMSCQYGKGIMCLDSVQTVLTPNGVCFAVNNNLTVERPGPETTLSLLLNLEVYEIIPGWVSEPGVMVSIYDPSVPASAYFGEGMHLEPGKVVTIPINDIRKLQRHSSECGRQRVGNFNSSEYSHVGCQWHAAYNNIEQSCQCISMRSPHHRQTLFGGIQDGKENLDIIDELHDSDRDSSYPSCNLRQEFSCVNNILAEPFDEKTSAERDQCPEDCTEVSFTTIVFGNHLDVNEIATFLPGDWEEEKEKRLNNFQIAFDILPNHRIPLVRNIQKLSTEAQNFLEQLFFTEHIQAIITFGISENITEGYLPCITDEEHNLPRTIGQLHRTEQIWKHVTSYIELVFQFHLGSLFNLLHLDIGPDYSLRTADGKQRETADKSDQLSKEIAAAIFDLQLIETSVNQPKSIFGLKSLQHDERKAVVSKIVAMVKETAECLSDMRYNLSHVMEYRPRCVKACGKNHSMFRKKKVTIFQDHYNGLRDARTVSTVLSLNVFATYSASMKKLIETLRRVKYKTKPKMFVWRNFDISLRQFEALYREGGKDSSEIHDLLKLRKFLQSDAIHQIEELSLRLNLALMARNNFFNSTELQPLADLSVSEIQRCIQCLHSLLLSTDALKKSNFLRAEWLSRLQRQVTIAKSYSPSPQYDEQVLCSNFSKF
uniref:Acid-sensing ion channel 5 n=1 Tax=Toxocara canis TaxID=6265 RepID=A0A183V3P7_TOXCA